ncbi:MAG: hypothetical protein ABWX94_01250 [Candidatus Saccharimonadales bacterium]
MTHGEKKFIIWFAAALLLWRIVHVPAIQNAFLQFLTVGEVPGMYGTLSPDTVFVILACIFSLSLILIFGKELKRSLTRRRVADAKLVVHAPAPVTLGAVLLRQTDAISTVSGNNESNNKHRVSHKAAKQQKHEPTIAIVIKRPRYFAGTPIPVLKLNLKDKKMPALYVPSLRPLGRRLATIGRKIGVLLRKGAAAEYDSLRTIFVFLWKSTTIVSGQIWDFAKPRIRRMQAWIGRRIRKNDFVAEVLEVIEEIWRSMTLSRRKTEKL